MVDVYAGLIPRNNGEQLALVNIGYFVAWHLGNIKDACSGHSKRLNIEKPVILILKV